MSQTSLVIGVAASLALGSACATRPKPAQEGPDFAKQVVAALLIGVARDSEVANSSAAVGGEVTAGSIEATADDPAAATIPEDPGSAAPTADQQGPAAAVAAPAPPAAMTPPAGASTTPPTQTSAGELGTEPEANAEPAEPAEETEAGAQTTQPEQQEPSTEPAQEPSEGEYEQPYELLARAEFPSGSGVDTLEDVSGQESAEAAAMPGERPFTLRERALATPAAAGVGTPEESRGVAGFTGAGAGQGFTGISAGSGFTGIGAGQGFTGVGAGQGFTGVGAGDGFTGVGAGEGFTGVGAGQGFTGAGAGQGSASVGAGATPYIVVTPGGLVLMYGFGRMPG